MWQGFQFTQAPYRFLDRCYEQYGENFILHLGSFPGRCHLISTPFLVREVFQAPPSFLGYHPVAHRVFGYLPDNSVILSNGRLHATRKKNLITLLKSAANRDIDSQIAGIISRALGDGGSFAMRNVIEDIVSRIVCLHVFGRELKESEFMWLFRTASKERLAMSVYAPSFLSRFALGMRDPAQNNRRYVLAQEFLKQLFLDGNWETESILGELAGRRLSADSVAANALEVLAFLFGTLTVSAMHGIFSYLKHEHARDELRAGVELSTPRSGCPFSNYTMRSQADNGTGLKERVSDFFAEVWRLYPDVPLTFRCANRSGTIAGIRLQQGDIVVPCIYLAHRNQDSFHNATEFRMNRSRSKNGLGSAYMPGGGGERKCPGINFALKVMRDLFSSLLGSYEVVPSRVPKSCTRLTTGMQAYRTDNLYASVRKTSA